MPAIISGKYSANAASNARRLISDFFDEYVIIEVSFIAVFVDCIQCHRNTSMSAILRICLLLFQDFCRFVFRLGKNTIDNNATIRGLWQTRRTRNRRRLQCIFVAIPYGSNLPRQRKFLGRYNLFLRKGNAFCFRQTHCIWRGRSIFFSATRKTVQFLSMCLEEGFCQNKHITRRICCLRSNFYIQYLSISSFLNISYVFLCGLFVVGIVGFAVYYCSYFVYIIRLIVEILALIMLNQQSNGNDFKNTCNRDAYH